MTNHLRKSSYGSQLSNISAILWLQGGGRGNKEGHKKDSPPSTLEKQGGGPPEATVNMSQKEVKKMIWGAPAKAVSDALAQQAITHNAEVANL